MSEDETIDATNRVAELFAEGRHNAAFELFSTLPNLVREFTFEEFYGHQMKSREKQREIDRMHANSISTLG